MITEIIFLATFKQNQFSISVIAQGYFLIPLVIIFVLLMIYCPKFRVFVCEITGHFILWLCKARRQVYQVAEPVDGEDGCWSSCFQVETEDDGGNQVIAVRIQLLT